MAFIVFNCEVLAQNEITGNYCVSYELKDVSNCIKLDNTGKFSHNLGGDLGIDYFGKGNYTLTDNYLILDYNSTKPILESSFKAKYWFNKNKDVVVNFTFVDNDGNTIKGVNIYELDSANGLLSSSDGTCQFRLMKTNEKRVFRASLLGYDDLEVSLNSNYNYNVVATFIEKSNFGLPILHQRDTLYIKRTLGKLTFFKENRTWRLN